MRHAAGSAILVSGWHRMGYSYSDKSYISQLLVEYIKKLHAVVGNAINHKFLWVVRAPSSLASDAYLSAQKDVDPLHFLPWGFLERPNEKGMVVPSWAPQIQVLSHSSVGGFLTHCGWNSILERVLKGVPFITWPLFAEQRMNAVLLCEGLKVGVRPRVSENGLVQREEIVKVIKCLMEGEEGGKMKSSGLRSKGGL